MRVDIWSDLVCPWCYRAYFTEQRSLFDSESLIELGAEAGLEPESTRTALHDDRYAELVAADLRPSRIDPTVRRVPT